MSGQSDGTYLPSKTTENISSAVTYKPNKPIKPNVSQVSHLNRREDKIARTINIHFF